MAFNNEVTYNDKWETPENYRWQRKAMRLAERNTYSPSVPLSWAKEVHEMLSNIEEKYGLAFGQKTFYARHYSNKEILEEMIPRWWRVKHTFKGIHKEIFRPSKYNRRKPLKYRLYDHLFTYRGSLIFGWRLAYHYTYGYLYNRFVNPQVNVQQIKEKYGHLTVYYSTESEEAEAYVKKQIHKTRTKLTNKGAYYKVDKDDKSKG